jgi:gluconokinase
VNKDLILGLDIGTSSVRAALYDHVGNLLPKTLVKNERTLKATADGGSEIDAEKAFKQVVSAIDEVLAKTDNLLGEITYVASCSFWHSLVGVGENGKPSTKIFGWADTRSRESIEVLRRKFDEAAFHSRTGARFHSSFWPAKLLWLRKEFPKTWDRTARWLSFSDYIGLKLFGAAATSVSMASGTGVFDIRQCNWDAELLRYLKVKSANLPQISEAPVFLNAKFSKRWPRLKNAQWFPAIADGAANNIGSGCVGEGKVALMVGTSGAMRVAFEGDSPKRIPSGLWCYRIDRKRVIIGGALSDGGGLYQWLSDSLKLPKNAETGIAKRPSAGHGLIFLPFLAGERSTGYNENATGAILGLRSSTDSIDILQAGMESVAYRFAEILDQLNEVVKINEIIASGGAIRESPVWTQIIADVLGRDLTISAATEASMRGACLLALESIGKIENIEILPNSEKKIIRADRTRHDLYSKARKRHAQIYKLLIQ